MGLQRSFSSTRSCCAADAYRIALRIVQRVMLSVVRCDVVLRQALGINFQEYIFMLPPAWQRSAEQISEQLVISIRVAAEDRFRSVRFADLN